MQVLKLLGKKSLGHFKLDEYTAEFGSIIFDGVKGGNISNSYFYRFNWTVETEIDKKTGKIKSRTGSFIDFYIDVESRQFKLIEFVSLKCFSCKIEEDLKFELNNQFYVPVIDVSKWVSKAGRIVSPYNDKIRYTKTEEQIKVQIIHNGVNIIQFVFGKMTRKICLNEQIIMYLDADNELSSLMIFDKVEIPRIITMLKNWKTFRNFTI